MLIHGDSLQELKHLESDSVDVLVTDPPYGYSFMGKSWDKALPDIGIFKECLRVLKPGAFAFVMSAPRSDVCARMAILLEDAGFRIDFTPIYWTYASGFPKAMNIGKMVDKREGAEREVIGTKKHGKPSMTAANGWHANNMEANSPLTVPATDAAKALDGSYGGFQPKPAVEVIIVAMKPLSEKTYVDQALANGKGITWLDDCRVPTSEAISVHDAPTGTFAGGEQGRGSIKNYRENNAGRFPANLLVSDDVLNDGAERGGGVFKQSGHRNLRDNPVYGIPNTTRHSPDNYGDKGSYSRYFNLDAWAQTLPFLAVPKASKSEKGKDCIHPTVKPLKLMSYLITLGSRPGDVVLDPFLGSGSTAVAAKELGRDFIGIEREFEYHQIAWSRIHNARPPDPQLFAA